MLAFYISHLCDCVKQEHGRLDVRGCRRGCVLSTCLSVMLLGTVVLKYTFAYKDPAG